MSKTSPVDINVQTQYLSEQSYPYANQFAFTYTVTITNKGNEAVQLLTRYWLITDGNEKTKEVKGKGVVGRQPLIHSGDSYTYTSGTVLETAIGTMEGSYQMVSASGDHFEAPIDTFGLSNPAAIH